KFMRSALRCALFRLRCLPATLCLITKILGSRVTRVGPDSSGLARRNPGRYITEPRLLVFLDGHTERKAQRCQLALHFLEGSLAEVANLEQFGLGHHHEIAHQSDVLAVQTVLRTNRKLEHVDALVEQVDHLATACTLVTFGSKNSAFDGEVFLHLEVLN